MHCICYTVNALYILRCLARGDMLCGASGCNVKRLYLQLITLNALTSITNGSTCYAFYILYALHTTNTHAMNTKMHL